MRNQEQLLTKLNEQLTIVSNSLEKREQEEFDKLQAMQSGSAFIDPEGMEEGQYKAIETKKLNALGLDRSSKEEIRTLAETTLEQTQSEITQKIRNLSSSLLLLMTQLNKPTKINRSFQLEEIQALLTQMSTLLPEATIQSINKTIVELKQPYIQKDPIVSTKEELKKVSIESGLSEPLQQLITQLASANQGLEDMKAKSLGNEAQSREETEKQLTEIARMQLFLFTKRDELKTLEKMSLAYPLELQPQFNDTLNEIEHQLISVAKNSVLQDAPSFRLLSPAIEQLKEARILEEALHNLIKSKSKSTTLSYSSDEIRNALNKATKTLKVESHAARYENNPHQAMKEVASLLDSKINKAREEAIHETINAPENNTAALEIAVKTAETLTRNMQIYIGHNNNPNQKKISSKRLERATILLAMAKTITEQTKAGTLINSDYLSFLNTSYEILEQHKKDHAFYNSSDRFGDALRASLPKLSDLPMPLKLNLARQNTFSSDATIALVEQLADQKITGIFSPKGAYQKIVNKKIQPTEKLFQKINDEFLRDLSTTKTYEGINTAVAKLENSYDKLNTLGLATAIETTRFKNATSSSRQISLEITRQMVSRLTSTVTVMEPIRQEEVTLPTTLSEPTIAKKVDLAVESTRENATLIAKHPDSQPRLNRSSLFSSQTTDDIAKRRKEQFSDIEASDSLLTPPAQQHAFMKVR